MYRDVPVRRPGVPREAGCRERPASDAAISKCLILTKRLLRFARNDVGIGLRKYHSAPSHLPLDKSAGMTQFKQHRLAFLYIEPVLGELVDAGDPVDAAEFRDVAQNIERNDFGEQISLIP